MTPLLEVRVLVGLAAVPGPVHSTRTSGLTAAGSIHSQVRIEFSPHEAGALLAAAERSRRCTPGSELESAVRRLQNAIQEVP